MPPEITRERLNFSMQRKVKWRTLTKRKDSFGREYIVFIDRTSQEPTGQIERRFTVPTEVVVPDEYLRFPEDKPWKVEVRWEQYALYLKKELREWQAIVKMHMKRLYGAKGVSAEPTAEGLEAAGPPPQDWRLIVLAMRGDPFLLGLTKKPTPAASKLLPELRTDIPTKKETHVSRELRLDPELEKLVGKTKGARLVEHEEEEDDLEERQAAADARRRAREMNAEGDDEDPDDDPDAEAERELQEIKSSVGDDDEGILDGGLGSEARFEVEESADPGAVGGTRVAVGSVKSRAKAKGRVRKAGG